MKRLDTTAESGKFSRRRLLTGAASLAATSLGSMSIANAAAETALEQILNANNRDSWDDQFDSRPKAASRVVSNTPVFAPKTIEYVNQAIFEYQNIVALGGWPVVRSDRKLEIGVSSPAVPVLRKRLMISGDMPASAGLSEQFDSYVEAAVKRFQLRHGLPNDGIIGNYSFAAINIPADIRLGQLRTNLVRLQSRAGLQRDRYVMVNIPAAQIEAVENGEVAQRHTAIVGKTSRPTPILDSEIYELNLNPYWTAPKSIVLRDIIPIVREKPTYLADNQILLFDEANQQVDPADVDWSTDEAVNYRFRQEPGRQNAMGSVKINFPNSHAVYLHDTPQKGLFNKLMRFDSSGCVRVKNVRDLLVWLARDTPGASRAEIEQIIASGERIDLNLAQPVPIHLTYISAWSTDTGVVQFRDDIYRRDGVDELALSQ